ncbi:hypothetical protein L7F22_004242 [Adiantum nelumboides]|nr:hypothetical protein [Adiantum nelumboides]
MEKTEETKQTDGGQQQPTEVDVPILIVQEEELTNEEAIQEVKSFDYTKLIQTLSKQFQCQQVVTKETEIQKDRANKAQEETANLRTALELKLNASYNTVKNTLTALLQNQEPTATAPSTSDSAALNTLAALQAELQTEKLQRHLLVSGFMSQTVQHETKVKQLEEELAKAKAELEAVGSLASTSQIHQAETHVPIRPPQLPEMPEFQGTEEEEQLRPAPGALDIREQMEQEIEDLPEGPAKEYLIYKKKVMESAALAFLQPEEQIKDFGSEFLPLPLMRHEAILWKEKLRPAVPRNEDGGFEGIPLTSEQAKTLIEDHPSSVFCNWLLVQDSWLETAELVSFRFKTGYCSGSGLSLVQIQQIWFTGSGLASCPGLSLVQIQDWLVSGLVHWLVSGQDWLVSVHWTGLVTGQCRFWPLASFKTGLVSLWSGSLVSFRTGLVTDQFRFRTGYSLVSGSGLASCPGLSLVKIQDWTGLVTGQCRFWPLASFRIGLVIG